MRRRLATLTAVVIACSGPLAVAGTAAAGALKPAASATVPGGSAEAEIESVSCASPGNCSAGGDYIDGVGNRQVFVADEMKL